MTHTINVPPRTWPGELKTLVDELHGQELQVWVERADTRFHRLAAGMYLHDAYLEAQGSERGAITLELANCCEDDAVYVHRLRAPDSLKVLRDGAGHLCNVTLRARTEETLHLVVAEEAPAPGRRRLSARLDRNACTHPNCPLAR